MSVLHCPHRKGPSIREVNGGLKQIDTEWVYGRTEVNKRVFIDSLHVVQHMSMLMLSSVIEKSKEKVILRITHINSQE